MADKAIYNFNQTSKALVKGTPSYLQPWPDTSSSSSSNTQPNCTRPCLTYIFFTPIILVDMFYISFSYHLYNVDVVIFILNVLDNVYNNPEHKSI